MTEERKRPGRKPVKRISLSLPLPPPSGISRSSWEDACDRALAEQRPPALSGYVRAAIRVGLVDGRTDLAAIGHRVIQLLELRGIVDEKRRASDLAMRFDRTVTPGLVEIEVAQTVAPALRSAADHRAKIASRMSEKWARLREQRQSDGARA